MVSVDAYARPANVTAAVKDRNNRARSVAAGVVSGAGGQPVLQKPHSDESAPSRSRLSLHPVAYGLRAEGWVSFQQGSWNDECVLTGGAGHKCTHERDDGMNPSQGSGGQVDSNSTCPSSFPRTAFGAARLGTGRAGSRAAKALSHWFAKVQQKDFQHALPL